MKKLLLLALAAAMLLSVCVFPASAEEARVVTEEWDDYDTPQIKFYDYYGTEHVCDVCGTGEDVVDVLGAFTWFQGGHLKNQSGHFMHVGAYCEITVENCSNIQWWTQYRGPSFYSDQATVYIDGEEVAVIGADKLQGENLTDPFMVWDSGELDDTKTHVIKIVNTEPMPEDFEGTEEDWIHTGERLPIDYFKVTYLSTETDPPLGTEWQPDTEPPVTDPVTTAPATEAEGTGATTDDTKTEEKGCGGMISATAIVMAAVLAAPIAISRKRK